MNNSSTQAPFWLYTFILLISTLLTVVELTTHNPIELDSLLYLKAAEVFGQHGIKAAISIYPWPFFSILIAITHKLFSLSYLNAGYLINILFQTLIAINFIRLIKALDADKQTLFFAVITIMLYPYLNKIRPYITRDFGYWAFALSGLLNLIQFSERKAWLDILRWYLWMGIATLFRIEGAIFLIFTPLIFLLPINNEPLAKRLIHTLKLYSPLLGLGILAILWKFHTPAPDLTNHSRLPELIASLTQGINPAIENINTKALVIGQQILNNIAFDDAKLFLAGGLISLFIGTIFKTLNPVYLCLSIYSITKKLLPANTSKLWILSYFITLNIFILAIFLAQHFFMVDRYVVFLNLILMLWIPFCLNRLFIEWRQGTSQSWIFPLISLLFFAFAIGGIIRFGYSKAYITEAGQWINTNTPANAKLYSNSTQVLFYAQRNDLTGQVYYLNPFPIAQMTVQTLQKFDYIALWQTKKDGKNIAIINNDDLKLIKQFQNKRGDKVLIFKTRTKHMSQNNDLIIGKGELAGKGVYANRDFKKGETVIQYHLRPLTKEEFERLPESEKIFTHSHWGTIYLYLEPDRYVNHSDHPNTYQDLINKRDIALRDIKKGEMITGDATKDDIS